MKFPTPVEWFTTIPLYSKYEFAKDENWDACELIYFGGNFDNFCAGCRKDSTFRRENPKSEENFASILAHHRIKRAVEKIELRTGCYHLSATCSRNISHIQYFTFYVLSERGNATGTVEKIGQYPSYGDLRVEKTTRYRHSLSNDQLRELSRAIGLAAHDVGVGAYVYLRRIFESLLEEAHAQCKMENDWDEDSYQRGRTSEKIALLKSRLPEFLVRNSAIYSILSKGIHELSETECLKHFETLRLGIELILMQRHEERERARLIKEAEVAIQKLNSAGGA